MMADMLVPALIELICLLIMVWLAAPLAQQFAPTYRVDQSAIAKGWLALCIAAPCLIVWLDFSRLMDPDDETFAMFLIQHLAQAYIAYLAITRLTNKAGTTTLELLTAQVILAGIVMTRYILALAWDIPFEIEGRAFAAILIAQGVLPMMVLRSAPKVVRPPLSERVGAYGFGRSSGARKSATVHGKRKRFTGPVNKPINKTKPADDVTNHTDHD